MEKGIHYIENVFEYNDLLGVETLHPLVSVIDLSKAHPMKHVRHIFGFYAIFLKEVKCGDLLYGRQRYDYQEGTLVCLAPGQVIGIEDNGEVYQPKGWALVFHPDLIRRHVARTQHPRIFILLVRSERGAAPLGARARNGRRLLPQDPAGAGTRYRPPQQTAHRHQHRNAARLLSALLRAAVHHPFERQS